MSMPPAVVDGPTVGAVNSEPQPISLRPAAVPTVGRRPRRRGRSAVVFDGCLALALLLVGLPTVFHQVHQGEALVLDLALTLPLIWRRRWPTGVFAVMALAAFVQWVANERIGADVALLVAFYTVAAREGRRKTVAAAAVLELGVVLASVRWVQGGYGNKLLVLVLLSGMVTAAGFIGANIRTRRAYLASIEDRNLRLELERDQQAQLAAAAERARIAREMHDIVAHNLSVMIALADGAALTADDDPARATTAMHQVSVTGRQALMEMRRLLGVLRDDGPATLEPQPGLTDLETLLTQVRLVGLRGELVTEGRLPALPAGLQLTIYRLVQEALTNTLKHAIEPHTATVRLRFTEENGLEVEVTDDGAAASRVTDTRAGHGINGMRERAAVYGGTVEAGPRPGRGWQVRGRFDLRASGVAS
jgi:signal transduction histidine kinase